MKQGIDLTSAELERVLDAHGHPAQEYRGDGMKLICRHCPYESYPCQAYRLAAEVQRTRPRQLGLLPLGQHQMLASADSG